MNMIDVTVRLILWDLPTLLIPPDSTGRKWDKYAHSDKDGEGAFHFKDSDGSIEFVINHENSVTITVSGTVTEDLIKNPNPQDKNHQQAIAAFYVRAFSILNHFILRYRFNTFNYRTHPIKWRVWFAPPNANTPIPSEFVVETPLQWKIDWDVDIEEDIDLPASINFHFRQDRSDGWVSYSYPVETLEKTYNEVSALIQGRRIKPKRQKNVSPDQDAYEIAVELLMQAQELVFFEQKQRKEERDATVCAAIITTASACEVFVKGFVQTHGSSLHRFLIKDKGLSVENLLHKVLADIPQIGKSLKTFNPELMHNIFLLTRARNNAVHKGKPQLTITQRREEIEEIDDDTERLTVKEEEIICPVEGWMVYSEMDRGMRYSDADGDFGSFVWDVLALIEWLRFKVGGQWLKPAVKNYWDQQSRLPAKTRESEILERTLALNKRRKH